VICSMSIVTDHNLVQSFLIAYVCIIIISLPLVAIIFAVLLSLYSSLYTPQTVHLVICMYHLVCCQKS
jgi:hypothetical protein